MGFPCNRRLSSSVIGSNRSNNSFCTDATSLSHGSIPNFRLLCKRKGKKESYFTFIAFLL